MIQPDKTILQEHKFYESGNIKDILPLMKLQNYETNVGDDSSCLSYYIIGFMFIAAIYLVIFLRNKKGRRSVDPQKSNMGHMV